MENIINIITSAIEQDLLAEVIKDVIYECPEAEQAFINAAQEWDL